MPHETPRVERRERPGRRRPGPVIDFRPRTSPHPLGGRPGHPGGSSMLSREDNALLTQVGQGTPMGTTMRRYWIPALLARELPEPDCPPVRVKLLGEDLVAFRDTEGR